MAGSISNAEKKAALDNLFADPATWSNVDAWIGLFTTNPTDADGAGAAEVNVANGYDRISAANANWGASGTTDPATKSNSAALQFPAASGDWPSAGAAPITGVGFYTAQSAGTFLGWTTVDGTPTITGGDQPEYAIGALDITFTQAGAKDGGLTSFSHAEILDQWLNGGAYAGANGFVALSTTTPTVDGTNFTEPTPTNGYARFDLAATDWDAPAAPSGTAAYRKTISSTVTFPTATGSGYQDGVTNMTHWGVYDIVTIGSGNLMAWGPLSVAKAVGTGEDPSFAPNQIWVEFGGTS